VKAYIRAIASYLPARELTNEELAASFGDWTAERIEDKTGIATRHIAGEDEFSSDLGTRAAENLFRDESLTPDDIDFLLFCTQTPDYILPTTACVLQHRLGLRTDVGALDVNLGCSGYVYGLSLAKALIEACQVRNVLLVTADTYSKLIHPRDRSVRTLFGDASTATLISSCSGEETRLGPFVFGTDGRGAPHLIVPCSGMRQRATLTEPTETIDSHGNVRTQANLFMNGPEIFAFTIKRVPGLVRSVLEKAGRTMDQVDLFVFHQANRYMLEHLRKNLGIAPSRFVICLRDVGNTVSGTVPLALKHAAETGVLKAGQTVCLVGFGVGYSWAACLATWGAVYAPPPACEPVPD
jgi:3-oxoacyl-[acyl-carrier-protein] synthase-3